MTSHTFGGIAAGLGGTEEEQQEQIDAIADVTHTTRDGEYIHTTDIAAEQASAENIWNAVTPDIPGDDDGDGIPEPGSPGLSFGLIVAVIILLWGVSQS